MKKILSIQVALLFVWAILSGIALGQVPQLFNYQGVLIESATGQPVPDDIYSMVFSIYNTASGGSAIWTESQSVSTKDGVYNVLLGSSSSLTSTVLSGPEKYLGIKVGEDQEMTPRKRIVSVAYAILSEDADKLDGKEATEFADATHTHDDRYYTETELNTSDGDPPNQGSNRLSWDNFTDVPEGFADGVDNVNGGGGNTLDQAYDQGGPGAGRSITADAGAVNIEGADGLTVNGDVGIGTTNPTEKLQVAGTIHTTLNGFKFPDGTVQTTAATGTGDITAVTAGTGLTGGGESGDVTLDVGAGTGITVTADAIALNTTFTDGKYVNEEQANSIANLMITNDAVTSDKIAADAVGSSEVADNSLTAPDLAVNVVSSLDGVTSDGGDIDLVADGIISITPDDDTDKITISATGFDGNTLDQAYDQGGPGAGRNITADAGEVLIDGPDGLVVEGNVGIGIEPPTEKLHVGGNIQAEENLYAPNGVGMFRGLELSQYAVVDGNVGIGTMSPTSSLDIQLSGELDALTVRANSGSGRADLYQQGPDNSIAFELDDPTSGASKVFLSPTMSSFFNGGNVGIGTMSPDANLTIEGSSDGLALVKINQTGNRNYTGLQLDRNNAERWFIGMTDTDDNLILKGTALSDDVDFNGYPDMVIDADGNVGIGTTSPTSSLEIKGSGNSSATSSLNVTDNSGTSVLYVGDDGKVGLGTMSPSGRLDVQLSGALDAFTVLPSVGSGSADFVEQGVNNSITFALRDPTSGFPNVWLSPKSDSWFIGGNVGIGTQGSSDAKLAIEGYSDGLALVKINQTGNRNYAGLRLDRKDVEKWFIGMNGTDDKLIFRRTASSNDVVIDDYGKVGIGTTNPLGKLDVNGPIFQRGSELHADYVFEPDYQLETIEDHAKFMWKNKHLKAIPEAKADENGRQMVEVGAHRKGIVEELEKAHVYIEQLHKRLKFLEEKLAKMEVKFDSRQ